METLLLLIIIGIISSVFGKGKGNKQGPNRKPLTRNTFEEMKTLFQDKSPEPVKTEFKEIKQTIPENVEKRYVKTQQEINDNDQPVRRQSYQERIEKLDRKVKEPVANEGQEEPLFTKDPDAKVLINGIIWSEILGEPRSKKSHFTSRR